MEQTHRAKLKDASRAMVDRQLAVRELVDARGRVSLSAASVVRIREICWTEKMVAEYLETNVAAVRRDRSRRAPRIPCIEVTSRIAFYLPLEVMQFAVIEDARRARQYERERLRSTLGRGRGTHIERSPAEWAARHQACMKKLEERGFVPKNTVSCEEDASVVESGDGLVTGIRPGKQLCNQTFFADVESGDG